MAASHLDTFISKPAKSQNAVAISPEIRDRGSLFVGALYRATTPREAHANVAHVKHLVNRDKKATHDISAWRCMVLKPGRNGLGGPDDFELVQGSKDDGESWAGGKVLKVMQQWAVLDAVGVVSRWYGGTMLGPARFSHIETCATEVCKAFKRTEELQDCIATLEMLDDTLSGLRTKLAALNAGSQQSAEIVHSSSNDGSFISKTSQTSNGTAETPNGSIANDVPHANSESSTSIEFQTSLESKPDGTAPDNLSGGTSAKSTSQKSSYVDIDIAKAKRLVQARENAIKAVRNLIVKKEKEQAVLS